LAKSGFPKNISRTAFFPKFGEVGGVMLGYPILFGRGNAGGKFYL